MRTATSFGKLLGKTFREAARDMTGVELAKANAANIIDAAGIVTGQTLQIAAKAGCIGMALEGVVSLGENMIYVYAGERTAKEAVIDVSKNMAQKGMTCCCEWNCRIRGHRIWSRPSTCIHGTSPGYDWGHCLLAWGRKSDSRSISSGEFRDSNCG